MVDRVHMNHESAKHVQAYIEYQNIVGNDDNGRPFSEKEFEEYKERVKGARKNRLYASYRNPRGLDCKNIGPASQCFCGHRYRDHAFDNVDSREVYCKERGCLCPLFQYIPVYGSMDFKCFCKHSCTEHDPITKKCTVGRCGCPQRFTTSASCNCGSKYMEHKTLFESREQRLAQGKPVDRGGGTNMNAAMGGVTDFVSMADGVERLELMDSKKKSLAPDVASKTNSGLKRLPQDMGVDRSQGKKKSTQIRQPPADFFEKAENRHLAKGGQANSYSETGHDYTAHGPSADRENSAFQLYNAPHIFGSVSISYNQLAGGGGGGQKRLGYTGSGHDAEDDGYRGTGFKNSVSASSTAKSSSGTGKLSRAQAGIEKAKEMARKKQEARERSERIRAEKNMKNMSDDLRY